MTTYANKTKVPIERTKEQIEALMIKYGATGFGSAWKDSKEVLWFECQSWQVRFVCEQPDRKRFEGRMGNGQYRSKKAVDAMVLQANRAYWRGLLLLIQAKLVAIEAGIRTFEEEFALDVVMPNGQRTSEWVVPQLRRAYQSKEMPPMLPGGD